MNERIRELRKTLGLTQQEFADRIGIARGNVAAYEVSKNAPSDAVVSLICREFGVSEAWLRKGEGEMLTPTPEDEVEAIVQRYGLGDWEKTVLRKYLALTPGQRQQGVDFMKSLGFDIREPGAMKPIDEMTREEIEDYLSKLDSKEA